ncbi:MAG: 50S ribosomal protein L29 [Chlamydiales bacterium]|nr:50S ribosomal protein L29 [Chlamydiia bacterium]MCP5506895.1 50S ribosomal protein L29 [Chlamydiales bacterium]
MKAKDLRDKSTEEIQALLHDTRKELFVLVNEVKMTKKSEKPDQIFKAKKNIARMLTILREKQLAAS